jgi:hypothetical protein
MYWFNEMVALAAALPRPAEGEAAESGALFFATKYDDRHIISWKQQDSKPTNQETPNTLPT